MIRNGNGTVDVFGLGNALVDILAFVSDDFIREHSLNKGTMTLVDAEKQGGLLADLEGHQLELHSGGSAANTMMGVVLSGGSAIYNGKVAGDPNGEFYRKDLLKYGIHFDVHRAQDASGPTGTSLILTTPDAERTMCTNLGVSTDLDIGDIDLEKIGDSHFLYLEGYLWDAEKPKAACIAAGEEARKGDTQIALTFSDPFCVDRYREEFSKMVGEYCDIVFCNAEEARRFSGMESLMDAVTRIGALADLVFVTDSKNGALVVEKKEINKVPGFSVEPLDTTGAGDAFAAGVLYALSRRFSPQKAARWGNYLAAQTIIIPGARLEESQGEKAQEVLDSSR